MLLSQLTHLSHICHAYFVKCRGGVGCIMMFVMESCQKWRGMMNENE